MLYRAEAEVVPVSEDPNTFVHHPRFPSLPLTVPLTFTLTMKACLSELPNERPTFGQIATIFEDLVFEVDTGTYISSSGQVMVRTVQPYFPVENITFRRILVIAIRIPASKRDSIALSISSNISLVRTLLRGYFGGVKPP